MPPAHSRYARAAGQGRGNTDCSLSACASPTHTTSPPRRFAQGEGFAPATGFGKLLVLSYSFFVLLTVSAYTASLATSLISEAGLSVGYSSFGEAISQDARVCVLAGTETERFLDDQYAHVNKVAVTEEFLALARDECDVAVSSRQPGYDLAYVSGEGTNPGCTLAPIGGHDVNLKNYGGGW